MSVPTCFLDKDRSPSFVSALSALRKRFPHIDNDLDEIWIDIARDHRNARKAESIPKFNDTLFKYRCKCSDMQRGASGGYRIISYYHKETNILYPIFIYHKADQSDINAKETVNQLTELLDTLRRDSK
jgi:mRNA-degrading endonuclease RelE of RelBE toxin-antitoxin system